MRIFSFRKIRRLFSFASMGIARASGHGVRRRNAFKQRRDAFSAWRLNSEQLEPKKMLATDISTRLPDLVAGDDSGYLDDDNYTSDTTPSFTLNTSGLTFGTAATGNTTPLVSEDIELVIGGTVRHSITQAPGTTPPNITLTVQPGQALADGTYNVQIRVRDTNGATTNSQTLPDLVIDTTAPDLEDVGRPSDGTYTSGTSLNFTAVFNEPVFNTGGAIPLVIGTGTFGQPGSIDQAALAGQNTNNPSVNTNTPTTTINYSHTVGGNDQNDADGIRIGGFQIAADVENNVTIENIDTTDLAVGMAV